MRLHPFPISRLISQLLWLIIIILLPPTIFIALSNKIILLNWEFMASNSSPLSILFLIDPKGIIFSCIVLFISANVLQFANCYISNEKNITRFTHLVILFVLSINLLIYIPHLIRLLLGWDGLGIVSFLLVAYYQNPKSLGAGIITALSNRVGDVLILLSIGWALNQGHWNVLNIWNSSYTNLIILSIMVAGITKSAQMPFSSWLPAAIAAPTPVSALVHSSTLVTAGVFLLIRFYPFLHTLPKFNTLLLIIASLTILIAGSVAIMECDLKKIIALSTLSQLGVIIAAIGLNYPILAFFHLLTHALFKALLFICAGSLIHHHHHTQDLRQIGNVFPQIPLTTSCLLTANLALCGIPFIAGFYSKDLILEFSLFSPTNYVIITIFFLATMLTSAYSLRIIIARIWSPHSTIPIHNLSNTNNDLTSPALFLTIGAISGGAALNWVLISPCPEPILPTSSKLFPLFVTILGLILTWINSSSLPLTQMNSSSNTVTFSLNTKIPHTIITIWFLTPLTSQKILFTPTLITHLLIKSVDQGWIETLGGKGTLILSSSMTRKIQHFQSNLLTSHLLLSALAFIPLILIFFYLSSLHKALHWSCKNDLTKSLNIIIMVYINTLAFHAKIIEPSINYQVIV